MAKTLFYLMGEWLSPYCKAIVLKTREVHVISKSPSHVPPSSHA